MSRILIFLVEHNADIDNAITLLLRTHNVDTETCWLNKRQSSLVDLAMHQGLGKYSALGIIVSFPSMQTTWMKELDLEAIKLLRGKNRLIFPIKADTCSINAIIHRLQPIDVSEDIEAGVKQMMKEMQDGKRAKRQYEAVCGLDPLASEVGLCIALDSDNHRRYERSYTIEGLRKFFDDFSDEQYAQAVLELRQYGLMDVTRDMSWFASRHEYYTEPTYALYIHFADKLHHDPHHDILSVAEILLDWGKSIEVQALERIAKIPAGRVHRSLHYLEDYGAIVVRREFPAPFHIATVQASKRTEAIARHLAKEHKYTGLQFHYRERNCSCHTS